VLGREHPDTLTTLNNLAIALYDQSKYAASELLYRQVLKGREKVLGREHPDTLTTLEDLADALELQGKHTEAEILYR
jgi:Tetratricopeptide repeat